MEIKWKNRKPGELYFEFFSKINIKEISPKIKQSKTPNKDSF